MKTLSSYQKFVIAVLAFLQFSIILDFMIISPLGALLMPALKISPAQFGIVVSGYAFSAGLSGLLAAGFADRYDRKKILLFFYTGFVLGTLLCAWAPSYEILLGARILTGLFGGVIGSVVFAIVTDLFPLEQRGRVMGYLQTAFAASQILGLPAGLFFANLWGWHSPFLIIVFFSVVVGVFIFWFLKPIDGHLKLQVDRNPFYHLWETVSTPRYLLGFAATALLSVGGFMLMPFSSAFTVHNLGIEMGQLPLIYFATGVAAIFIGPLVGRASDAWGKWPVFVFGSLLSMLTVFIYTNLGVTPLGLVILVNVVMFVSIFSRMIPAQALTSAIPTPASRGSYMSVSSSLQQMAGGLASVIAGQIVVEESSGHLAHFDVLGYVLIGTATFSLVMMSIISKRVQQETRNPRSALPSHG